MPDSGKSRRSTRDVVPGFGEAVRRKRAAIGLTLADLAGQIGSTPSAISEIERGTRSVSLRLGLDLARALDTTIEELAGAHSTLTLEIPPPPPAETRRRVKSPRNSRR